MLKLPMSYENGTPRFWCFKFQDSELIVKVWVPHSRRLGDGRYIALPPPTTMDIHLEFDDVPTKAIPTKTGA